MHLYITRYVFRVAVDEEEGGKCVVLLTDSPLYKDTTGGYFSAVPSVGGGKSFGPVVASAEARDESKAKLLWELTDNIVKKYI